MVDFPIVNFATHQDVVQEVAGLGIIKRDRLQLLPPLGERDSRDNPRLSSIHHFNSSEVDEVGGFGRAIRDVVATDFGIAQFLSKRGTWCCAGSNNLAWWGEMLRATSHLAHRKSLAPCLRTGDRGWEVPAMLPREVRAGAELLERAEKEAQLLRRQIAKSIDQVLALRLNGPVDRKHPRKTNQL